MNQKVYRGYRVPDPEHPEALAALHVNVGRVGRPEKAPLNPRLDLRNHSPTGFECGYGGSGPAQLALALLCDALEDEAQAQALYMDLKDDLICTLPRDHDWALSQNLLCRWARGCWSGRVHERLAERIAEQAADQSDATL